MYGTLPGTWYLAPGSKSVALRGMGGITPPYDPRSSHHRLVY